MGLLISFIVAFVVGILWVHSIDKMKKDHPDYDGDDFLN